MKAYPVRLTRVWLGDTKGYGWYEYLRCHRHYVSRARPHMTPCDHVKNLVKLHQALSGNSAKK